MPGILEGKRITSDNVVPLADRYISLFQRYITEVWTAGYTSGQQEVNNKRAIYEAHRAGASIRVTRFSEVDYDMIPRDALDYLANKTAFQGKWNRDLDAACKTVLMNALEAGSTIKQIQDALKTVFRTFSGSRLENIARTETTGAYNKGRLAVFQENDDFVAGVQFMAIIDDRTTDICRSRDGRILRLNDPKVGENTPPMHYMCRSILSPISEFEMEDLRNGDKTATRNAFGYLDRESSGFSPPENLNDAMNWREVAPPLPGFGKPSLITEAKKAIEVKTALKAVTKIAHNGIINEKAVDVWIDELTPCLVDKKTQKAVPTSMTLIANLSVIKAIESEMATGFKKYKKQYLEKGIKERFNWITQWNNREKNSEFYALTIEGDNITQGMVEVRIHQGCVETVLAEVAPHNFGEKGKYGGTGAHLFAQAVKRSYETGGYGYVFFEAKTSIISHYAKTLGAKVMSGRRMTIEGKNSKELYMKYFGDKK